ncbi:hypothetical protein ABVF61_04485 [Roseibium sp. HPY-6]|uniref:hypothetical protein n=1 Tax=Roseibium sp. HPY-6 TaxID=3229852 RepID=UPI00338E129D
MLHEFSQARHWLVQDKFRFIVFLEVAAAGFLVALMLAEELGFGQSGHDLQPSPMKIASLAAAGGAVSGLLLSGWFGRAGIAGWGFAVLASVLSPVLAGAIGGSLVAPGLGTVWGAIMPMLLFVHLKPFAVWLGCLFIIHLHVRHLRRRDLDQNKIGPSVFE